MDIKDNLLECGENQKVWVIGDVHGCYHQFLGIINSPLITQDDVVILIGDIIDRGPDSVKMLDWALENVNNGGKYLMIRGNHEQNIIDDYNSLQEIISRKNRYRMDAGEKTIDYKALTVYDLRCDYDFCEYMERAGILRIGEAEKYIKWMMSLPLFVRVKLHDGKKFLLAHAWFEGKLLPDGKVRPLLMDEDIVWQRDVDYNDRFVDEDYHPMEAGEMLVHGHTPIPIIQGYRGKLAEPVFREHSINIDGGCFIGRKLGGRLIALCLNDFRSFYSS